MVEQSNEFETSKKQLIIANGLKNKYETIIRKICENNEIKDEIKEILKVNKGIEFVNLMIKNTKLG